MNQRHIETIILVGAIGLLQWHGGWFWYNTIGWTGVIASVLVEITALYLWYLRGRRNTFAALIGSLLIIGGPLYQTTHTLWEDMVNHQADATMNTKLVESFERELAINETAFSQHIQIKTTDRRDKAEAARTDASANFDAYRDAIKAKNTTDKQAATQWLEKAKVGMQALFLIFLQIAQITIARRWGLQRNTENATLKRPATPMQRPVTVARNVAQTSETQPQPVNDAKVQQVIDAVLGGKYKGEGFTVRNIIATEGVRHEHVKAAFDQMADNGQVERIGNKFKMVNA